MSELSAQDKIDVLLARAYDIAEKEMIRLARKYMKEHSEIEEFIIAMGTYYFVKKEKVTREDPSLSDFAIDNFIDVDINSELGDFIAKNDGIFNLSGAGMRFTATGKIVTDW